ncbi:MAG: hypothetical protein PHP44_13140 [Kiritimatiellae bacterium]|nr:hypothetical protein [Kiritimatiellia bacterium]
MKQDSKRFLRKHPVHMPNIERLNQPVILFVTVCARERRSVLASERVHQALVKVWSDAVRYRVGYYMIMPDHVHLFCSPSERNAEKVSGWVGYWKRLVNAELKDLGALWQRDCWGRQLRHVGHYEEKWEYVSMNPVRKGLVHGVEKWPYKGCLNELRW